VIVFFGQSKLLNFTEEAQIVGLRISEKKSYVLILTKNGWTIFWAIFSKNSSAHPEDHISVSLEVECSFLGVAD
jgi:hypothetical protein